MLTFLEGLPSGSGLGEVARSVAPYETILRILRGREEEEERELRGEREGREEGGLCSGIDSLEVSGDSVDPLLSLKSVVLSSGDILRKIERGRFQTLNSRVDLMGAVRRYM